MSSGHRESIVRPSCTSYAKLPIPIFFVSACELVTFIDVKYISVYFQVCLSVVSPFLFLALIYPVPGHC